MEISSIIILGLETRFGDKYQKTTCAKYSG
jgi:hypothetical protein